MNIKENLINFYVLGLKGDLLTQARKSRIHKGKDRFDYVIAVMTE